MRQGKKNESPDQRSRNVSTNQVDEEGMGRRRTLKCTNNRIQISQEKSSTRLHGEGNGNRWKHRGEPGFQSATNQSAIAQIVAQNLDRAQQAQRSVLC